MCEGEKKDRHIKTIVHEVVKKISESVKSGLPEANRKPTGL